MSLHTVRASSSGLQRSAFPIDVLSVGLDGERRHRGAELVEHLGAHVIGRPVGAVDRNAQPSRVKSAGRCSSRTRCSGRRRRRCGTPCRCRLRSASGVDPCRRATARSRARLRRAACSRCGEELDPVVLEGIVRRRDDRARVGAQRAGEKSIPESAAADSKTSTPIEQMPEAIACSSMYPITAWSLARSRSCAGAPRAAHVSDRPPEL